MSFYCSDTNPSILFEGVKTRLMIFICKKNKKSNIYTTNYYRWYAVERDNVFKLINYSLNKTNTNTLLKIGNLIENNIVQKILTQKDKIEKIVRKNGNTIYYHNVAIFWTKCFLLQNSSVQYKKLCFDKHIISLIICSLLNSSLFFIWWIMYSDCYHITKKEIYDFCILIDSIVLQDEKTFIILTNKLLESLNNNSILETYNYKTTGIVSFKRYFPQKSKPIIDEIDKVLSKYYGFTDEELDYIINYDIKYRMGDALNGDEDEE